MEKEKTTVDEDVENRRRGTKSNGQGNSSPARGREAKGETKGNKMETDQHRNGNSELVS